MKIHSVKTLLMDSIFVVDDVERSSLLQLIFQSFGCTYICIWSYLPHPSDKCLVFKDGLLMDPRNDNFQGESSSESLTRRLFTEYKQSAIKVDNEVTNCVPGFAFKNNTPFLELKEMDLQGFASLKVQRQFYLEANIKRAIFMGCNRGEIELGFGSVTQVNLEMELRKLFPDDFLRQVQFNENDQHSLKAFQDQQGSSSSSSLRSVSMGSPETSALLPTYPYYNTTEAFRPTTIMPPSTNNQVYQATSQPNTLIPNSHFPSEAENDVIASAILAVLSASPSTLCHSSIIPYFDPLATLEGSSTDRTVSRSAFTRFSSSNLPSGSAALNSIQQNPNRVSAFKRIISYTFKSLHLKRLHEMHAQSGGCSGGSGKRPTSSQLQHMISERKRRLKMNESFDALRTLLPPGTKKHRALVLNGAIDYLTSLQAQVVELSLRNLRLEAQLLPRTETQQDKGASSNSSGGIESKSDHIQFNILESTSNDDRLVDARVTIRGEISLLTAVTRVVDFIRRINDLSLMSMEAETILAADSSTPSNHIYFRFGIAGSDQWDESAFQEALRRIVSDVAPSQP